MMIHMRRLMKICVGVQLPFPPPLSLPPLLLLPPSPLRLVYSYWNAVTDEVSG